MEPTWKSRISNYRPCSTPISPTKRKSTRRSIRCFPRAAKLEREFTAMNLDLRKQLSLEQWRQLKTIRGGEAMPGDHMFFFKQKLMPGTGQTGGPDETRPLPPPPPPGFD